MTQDIKQEDVWLTHLRLAERSARMGLWRIHDNGEMEWDEGTYHLFGVDPQTTTPPIDILYGSVQGADKARCTAWLDAVFESGNIPRIEHLIQWPDGSQHWIHSSGVVHQQDGSQVALGISWDVTDVKLLHDSLYRTQKELLALNQSLIEHEKSLRQKMAFELHDYIGQDLLIIRSGLCGVRKALQARHPGEAPLIDKLQETDDLIGNCFSHIRFVLDGLYSPVLTERGFVDAVHDFLMQLRKEHKHIEFRWIGNGGPGQGHRYAEAVEYAVYMIAREALQNAVKHASAPVIQVMCATEPDYLRLEVSDTGVGFDAKPAHPQHGWNLGFLSMRERARQIGADLTVSSSINGGTQVLVQWQKP